MANHVEAEISKYAWLPSIQDKHKVDDNSQVQEVGGSYEKQDYVALVTLLEDDVIRCADLMIKAEDQFHRRMYVRAIFAYIEGAVWAIKQDTLQSMLEDKSSISKQIFNEAEVAYLEDKSYDLSEKGAVILKEKAKISLETNIKFAFAIHAKHYQTDFTLDIQGNGWESVLRAIKIRDRITHPKNLIAMNITEDEKEIAGKAIAWFSESLIASFHAVIQKFKREIAVSEAQMKAAKNKLDQS